MSAILDWGAAVVEGLAAVALLLAARHATGVARVAWALFAGALGLWAITDGVYAFTTSVLGRDVAEASVFDVGWLGFYPLAFAGILMLYRELHPGPDWRGAIDTAALVFALGLLGWALVLQPASASAEGGSLAVALNLLYPALDILALAAVGWILIRSPEGSPPWLWLVAAAFGVALAGGLLYQAAHLHGFGSADPLSAAAYAASAAAWCAAGLARRRDPVRLHSTLPHTRTAEWSGLVPFAAAGTLTVVLLLGGGVSRIIAFAGLAVVGVRLVLIQRTAGRSLAERDLLLGTDPLTGAYNRRFLEEEIPRALARATRSGDPLSAIALDLDRFKRVNDSLGHSAGDTLLTAVVAEVRSRLRLGDVLCRVGGDEFVVLLPGADTDVAREVGMRIVDGTHLVSWTVAPDCPVSVSIGVATYPRHASGPDDLLCAADAALYSAKAAGRDCVVVAADADADARRITSDPVRSGAVAESS
jgi:diguanylate cyclase (GGDEF)-like protein